MLMDIFFCRSWYCDICFLGVLIWQFFLSSLLPCFTFLPVLLLSCWIAKQTWGTVFCKGRKITKPTFLATKFISSFENSCYKEFDKNNDWGRGVICFSFLKSVYFFTTKFVQRLLCNFYLFLKLEFSKWKQNFTEDYIGQGSANFL